MGGITPPVIRRTLPLFTYSPDSFVLSALCAPATSRFEDGTVPSSRSLGHEPERPYGRLKHFAALVVGLRRDLTGRPGRQARSRWWLPANLAGLAVRSTRATVDRTNANVPVSSSSMSSTS